MLRPPDSCPSFCMVFADYQWHGKCVLAALHVYQLATVFTCWALECIRTEAQSLQKLLYYIYICLYLGEFCCVVRSAHIERRG